VRVGVQHGLRAPGGGARMTTHFSLQSNIRAQIADAYRRMSEQARYPPAAPSDGVENITVPSEDLDLEAEAADYAEHLVGRGGGRRVFVL
jgi:hypothetical protein